MANASIDENHTPTILGTLQSDGVTAVPMAVNPTSNSIKVMDGTTGTASTRTTASRDGNGNTVWMGVSSADMTTLIPIAVDASGNLLIKST